VRHYACPEHGTHRAYCDRQPDGRVILKCRLCRRLDVYTWRLAYPAKHHAIQVRYREKNRDAIRERNKNLWSRMKDVYNAHRRQVRRESYAS